MAEWNRREWLQAAFAAAEPGSAGWRLAFRFDAGSVFLLTSSAGGGDGSRRLTPDPAHPDYAALLREGDPLPLAAYEVLTGRYGLLNATAVRRVYAVGRRPQAGVLLGLAGRDGARFAQLGERVFLAREARRGPLVWNPMPSIGKAKLPSLLRTQIEMLMERERRARGAAGRASRQVTVWTLDGAARPPLRLACGVWRAARRPVYAVTATVSGGESPRLDTVFAGRPGDMPEVLDCFSCAGTLLLAVRRPSTSGALYELWSRTADAWRTECSGPDFSG